jgi:hypothetical protein
MCLCVMLCRRIFVGQKNVKRRLLDSSTQCRCIFSTHVYTSKRFSFSNDIIFARGSMLTYVYEEVPWQRTCAKAAWFHSTCGFYHLESSSAIYIYIYIYIYKHNRRVCLPDTALFFSLDETKTCQTKYDLVVFTHDSRTKSQQDGRLRIHIEMYTYIYMHRKNFGRLIQS